ncbi:MAG: hypothetical protein ACRC5H_01815 [Treponemataceae bacterium]
MNFKDEFKLIPKATLALLLILFPVSQIATYINKEIRAEMHLSKPALTNPKRDDPFFVWLTNIDRNKVDIEKIDDFTDLPKELKEYLSTFETFYNKAANKPSFFETSKWEKDLFGMVESLIRQTPTLDEYLQNQGLTKIEAVKISEIIPFYCIKKNIQYIKNSHQLYALYRKNFADTTGILSEKSAHILCLYYRDRYFSSKKTDEIRKTINSDIDTDMKTFANQIGENSNTFKDQKNYLNSVKNENNFGLLKFTKKVEKWTPRNAIKYYID